MRLFHSAVITAWPFRWPVTVGPPCLRAVVVILATVLLGAPTSVYPLGLGKVIGEPVLGEPLRLEIPLLGSIEQALDSDCVNLRRPPESLEEDYLPGDLTARVDKQSGPARLLLTTRSALHQPLVEFRLAITCGYNLSNDYLLTVSPRSSGQPPATGNPQPSATLTVSTSGAVESPATAASPETGQGMPDGMAAKAYVIDRPMTLQQLARLHFPGPLRQERFIRWVAEANPEVFTGVANLSQHKLGTGLRLLTPSGVPPRRPGDHQTIAAAGKEIAPTGGETALSPESKPAPATRAVARDGSDPRRDRLVVSAGNGRDLRETMALVERLTSMVEQQMAAQTANDEKIQALEASSAELNKYVTQVEASARQRETQLQAEQAAMQKTLEEQTERGWWQLLVAVVAGGLLGAALMLIYRLFSTKEPGLRGDAADALLAAIPSVGLGNDSPRTASASQQDSSTATAETIATKAAADAIASPAAAPPPVKNAAPRRATVEPIEFEPPARGSAQARQERMSSQTSGDAATKDTSDPATAAIELANIMTSMGLSESAAQTLVEHIRENPRQSLHHWLKLLELHRLNGNRDEFERSTEELRQHFNVRADEWESSSLASPRDSLENYSHIRSRLIDLWRKSECVQFLQSLLMDNREGTRAGFPLPVAEEILLLIAIQSNT
jgi:hypothetical protein